MSQPLLSVIMPVFNASRYLDTAIESVLNQGVESLELICVDDGSTDDSGHILDGWASRDKRISLLRQENAGQGAARNRALDKAAGNFVAFIDADDRLLPGAVERMLAGVEDSEVLAYNFLTFTNDKDVPVRPVAKTQTSMVVSRHELLRTMGVVWNKLIRRTWLKAAEIRFPEGMIYEDIPVHWRLILLPKKIRHLAAPLYALRAHSDSTTSNAGIRRLDGVKAFRMVENFLHTSGNWAEFKDIFLTCQLRNLARVYDALAEAGHESIGRAAIESSFRAEQRAALHRLPLHWRDRDVFLSLEGHYISRLRRHTFRQCRKSYRLLGRLLNIRR